MRRTLTADRLIAVGAIALIAAFVAMVALVATILVTGWVTDAQNRDRYFETAAAYEHPEGLSSDLDAALTAYARSLGGDEIILRWDADAACGSDGRHVVGCVWSYEPAVVHLAPGLVDQSDRLLEKVIVHEVAHSIAWRLDLDTSDFTGIHDDHREQFAACAEMSVTDHWKSACSYVDQERARNLLGWVDGARVEKR